MDGKNNEKKKKGVCLRKVGAVLVSILAIVTVVLNVAANMFQPILDSYLGRGQLQTNQAENVQNWDTEYYSKDVESLEDAKTESNEISQQICEEGIVLLKNNGALPLKEGAEVTPFGYGYLNPAYSGTGAAATADNSVITVQEGLEHYFTVNTSAEEKMKAAEATYPDAAEGTTALDADQNSLQAMMDAGECQKIYEYPAEIYQEIKENVKSTSGIVFIRRNGSEGIDKRYEAYEDGTPHYLALTQNEKDMIAFVKENCEKCIVVLNTSNPMELTEIMEGEYEADAILWMGTSGSRGFEAMGKILCGQVNPSGRLADVYASDFTKDPTYMNFGEYTYTNSTVNDSTILDFIPGANKGNMNRKFVGYEEGIYVGYRYYETADVMDEDFVYGELDGKGGIAQEGAVTYPFGYGLSYTTFEQKITDFNTEDGQVNVTVEVTNTGDMAGKDVVQVYFTAPYTDFDAENGIEKSVTVLGGFNKTKTLQPGESETVNVTFSQDSMASYSDHHQNEDGTMGCYILESGEYLIELKNNSHDVIESRSMDIAETSFYEGDNLRDSDKEAQSKQDESGNTLDISENESGYFPVSNQFEDMNAYMDDASVTKLSRSNWKGTFPTMPENRVEEASQVAFDAFEKNDCEYFDYSTDEYLGNVEGSAVYSEEEVAGGENNGLNLIDMRGLDYNDEAWDALLDQIDWKGEKDNIQALLFGAAYQTGILESVGKPATTDKDGANGWSTEGSSSWASANVIACTWNEDLVYQMGEAIGQEGLIQGISGWYAPAMNIHRSPFGGRVYEYYSEDALLSGKLAAAAVSGAASEGVFSYIKHMALNEQETWRSVFLATWATEQAVREIYLKPFEICVKEAECTIKYIADNEGTVAEKTMKASTAVMSAQNNVGSSLGFAHYGMLTNVLRNEWGFKGAVVTDLYPSGWNNMRDMTLRAGSDLYMMNATGYSAEDYDSNTARSVMRNAIHNILYMTVNSNVMNGIAPGTTFTYSMSPWKKLLFGIDAAVALIVMIYIGTGYMKKKKAE